MSRLYYTPPPDDQFEEVREKAIEIWRSLNSHPSYENEKIGRIENIKNVSDNFMYIVAMFDRDNQRKLASKLRPITRTSIRERLVDGGSDPVYIVF